MERVIVDFRVKDAALLNEAKAAIAEFIDKIEVEEPGTLLYSSMQDKEEPTHFMHYMEFVDSESHQEHRTTEHVNAFVKKLYPLCAEEPMPTFLEAYREVRRS